MIEDVETGAAWRNAAVFGNLVYDSTSSDILLAIGECYGTTNVVGRSLAGGFWTLLSADKVVGG